MINAPVGKFLTNYEEPPEIRHEIFKLGNPKVVPAKKDCHTGGSVAGLCGTEPVT